MLLCNKIEALDDVIKELETETRLLWGQFMVLFCFGMRIDRKTTATSINVSRKALSRPFRDLRFSIMRENM